MPNTASVVSETGRSRGSSRSWLFWLTAAAVFLLDRASKEGVLAWLGEGSSLRVFRFFHLTCIRNKGICFGLFGSDVTRWPVIIGSAAILAFIVWYNVARMETVNAPRWVFGLIAGGILGNLYDRIFNGGVVDFLDFRVWPVFNVADTAIVTGVCLLVFLQLIQGRKSSAINRPPSA